PRHGHAGRRAQRALRRYVALLQLLSAGAPLGGEGGRPDDAHAAAPPLGRGAAPVRSPVRDRRPHVGAHDGARGAAGTDQSARLAPRDLRAHRSRAGAAPPDRAPTRRRARAAPPAPPERVGGRRGVSAGRPPVGWTAAAARRRTSKTLLARTL